MGEIADGSVDLVLCDLPYQVTSCPWDSVIPFPPLWEHYRRLLAPSGVVVLTATQPFTTDLIQSNRAWFRYCWVWDKHRAGNFFAANSQPLRVHEDVVVFAPSAPPYYPQMGSGDAYTVKRRNHGSQTGAYGEQKRMGVSNNAGQRHPTTLLSFGTPCNSEKEHPTQKPASLMAYLIRTYTRREQTVMDNCMGSGTTGEAAVKDGRHFIGIERDADFFALAHRRIHEAGLQERMTFEEAA